MLYKVKFRVQEQHVDVSISDVIRLFRLYSKTWLSIKKKLTVSVSTMGQAPLDPASGGILKYNLEILVIY